MRGRVQRINRMVLGVASPVARCLERALEATIEDIDDVLHIDASAACLVVGRQQLRAADESAHAPAQAVRLGRDVLDEAIERLPSTVIYVLPDRFSASRYALDLKSWQRVVAHGHRLLVLELAVLRELGEDHAVAAARETLARPAAAITSLFDGRALA